MTHLILVLALLSTLVVEHSWAAGPVGPGAVAPAQKGGADGVRERTGLRGARYCEIFVIAGRLNQIEGRVYNTLGLNDCPADQWSALDTEALKAQFNATEVTLNGPRFFLMDRLSLANPGGVATFGGLAMNLVAAIQMPIGSLVSSARRRPYTENTIERDTAWVFAPGRLVYELVSPENRVYVMQSYAHIVDDTLTEEALSRLAERLTLPTGWQYRVRQLDAEFVVRTVGGRAYVTQDDFENTYQRVDG